MKLELRISTRVATSIISLRIGAMFARRTPLGLSMSLSARVAGALARNVPTAATACAVAAAKVRYPPPQGGVTRGSR